MKKILKLIILLIIFFPNVVWASDIGSEIIDSTSESIGINDFFEQTEKYLEEYSDLDIKEIFLDTIKTGEIQKDGIITKIKEFVSINLKEKITTIIKIIIIVIIHAILKSVSEEIGKTGTSKIVFYLEYLLIASIIISEFSKNVSTVKDTINVFVAFMYSFIPILIVLVTATGSFVTGGISQKLIIFLISFIGGSIKKIVLPILFVSIILGVVGNFSDKVQLNRLSKYCKSFILWFLGIVLTLFVASISLEGTLSSSVDGITAKTAKAAVSSFIPVVGKILGDATDTVIGSMLVLKNAFGIVGIMVLILVSLKPILDLFSSMILFYILAAITEIVSEEKIVKIINLMADSYKILLAILISISVLFIIGISLIVKISNNGMMYR